MGAQGPAILSQERPGELWETYVAEPSLNIQAAEMMGVLETAALRHAGRGIEGLREGPSTRALQNGNAPSTQHRMTHHG